MDSRIIVSLLLLSLLPLSGCGGAVKNTEQATVVSGDLLVGLEMVTTDKEAALQEFELINEREHTPESMVRIGFISFLLGDYKTAKQAYVGYLKMKPNLSGREQNDFTSEINRIETAMAAEKVLTGTSLASSRLRGELALVRANEARNDQNWEMAYSMYKKASQYLPNTDLSFEAALAATKAEKHADALTQMKIYMATVGHELDRERVFAIEAEIDRLEVIAAGNEPITWESLADQIYAQRASSTNSETVPEPQPIPVQKPTPKTVKTEVATKAPSQEEEVHPKAGEQVSTAEAKANKEAAQQARKENLAATKAEKKAKAEEKREARRLAKQEAQQKAKEKREAKRQAKLDARQKAKKLPAPIPAPAVEPTPKPKAKGSSTGGYEMVSSEYKRQDATIGELMEYAKSPSSSVRFRAVKDLIGVNQDLARRVLEDRLVNDSNLQVRLAALDGLVVRGSGLSTRAISRALLTATTSNERARLKKALAILQLR